MKKIFLLILLAIFLCSCATKKQIEYRDRIVTEYKTEQVHDTTFVEIHDSIFQKVYQRGDTVYDVKYIEKIKYRDRIVNRIDTCWRDSIKTEYKEIVVEKKFIPKWCYYCLGICLILGIFAIVKALKWLKII